MCIIKIIFNIRPEMCFIINLFCFTLVIFLSQIYTITLTILIHIVGQIQFNHCTPVGLISFWECRSSKNSCNERSSWQSVSKSCSSWASIELASGLSTMFSSSTTWFSLDFKLCSISSSSRHLFRIEAPRSDAGSMSSSVAVSEKELAGVRVRGGCIMLKRLSGMPLPWRLASGDRESVNSASISSIMSSAFCRGSTTSSGVSEPLSLRINLLLESNFILIRVSARNTPKY